jgi:hypothetical protein
MSLKLCIYYIIDWLIFIIGLTADCCYIIIKMKLWAPQWKIIYHIESCKMLFTWTKIDVQEKEGGSCSQVLVD